MNLLHRHVFIQRNKKKYIYISYCSLTSTCAHFNSLVLDDKTLLERKYILEKERKSHNQITFIFQWYAKYEPSSTHRGLIPSQSQVQASHLSDSLSPPTPTHPYTCVSFSEKWFRVTNVSSSSVSVLWLTQITESKQCFICKGARLRSSIS